ncbi:FAD-dependent oxidoreductase [Paraglaciecola hydrolytica]|uniref:FAD-dependent oxidoreductase n=2 Tax=Paraglaciecola hydrolytica TaxID=1799789 RepID=A0A148KL11_9ALTE|nr:FAD-dependent oxidoreductase [Paraglaciecola hydrolytica]
MTTEGRELRAPLTKSIHADVCIVGGGYTGLWTAIKLRQKSSDLDIVIIEKDLCGQGASGRNGGCMLTFSSKFRSLEAHFGLTEAIRLVKASENAVLAIHEFCLRHGIDAEVRPHGAVYTATNNAQQAVLQQPLTALKQQQLNHWTELNAADLVALTGSTRHLAGIFSPHGGTVHPGKLVRGLAQVAQNMGIRIFEHTEMENFSSTGTVQINTPKGRINAKKLILATNAWTPRLIPQFNRAVVLVSSDMLITDEQVDTLQHQWFTKGTAVADSRLFVHYYRNSQSGRIMLGKGGNYFSYANRMLPLFDQPSRFESMLNTAFKSFFPHVDSKMSRSWTGASDRSVSGLPFFGHLPQQNNVLYGFGYSGNGVVQSFLGGEFLSSMVLGLDDEWTRSGMAQGVKHFFPPEPLCTLGARLIRHSVLRIENREETDLRPFWFDKKLASLAVSAGKVDK